MMRQIGKQILTLSRVVLIVLAAAGLGPAVAQEGVMINPLTGVAIDGYDPVTYFTEGDPRRGSPQYVTVWGGAPWYFVSKANLDVFESAPEVYAPQFGGHGAMALARGHLSDGNPDIYLIAGERLFLFYSIGNREAFRAAAASALAQAQGHWERLRPRSEPAFTVPASPVVEPLP